MRSFWAAGLGAIGVVAACATGATRAESEDAGGGGAGVGGSAVEASSSSSGASAAGGASSSTSTSSISASSSGSSSSGASSSASSSAASSSSAGTGGGPVADCTGCTVSPAGPCTSDVVVVGHYEGGTRTICIAPGDGSPFQLALMSYEATAWVLGGATYRVSQIQVYGLDPGGSISGNGAIPTAIQTGGSVPADPYDYAMSMGDCPAHTGYAGAVFGVLQASVCHEEQGLPDACGYPAYACLQIDP